MKRTCCTNTVRRPIRIVVLAAAVSAGALLAGCQAGGMSATARSAQPDKATADAPLGTDDQLASAGDVAGLVKAQTVIDAKIARKSASKGKKKPLHPSGLARERLRDRQDENGLIPPNALIVAKDQARHMPELAPDFDGVPADGGIWEWEWLGPGNVGGRIRTIVIHPTSTSTMWIGSVAGGIWKTTNGGSAWSPVNDFLASLSVTTMVIDPADPNIMYAGTGEGFNNADALPGAGVFKSTDGGVTWSQLAATVPTNADPTTDPWGFVNRLTISPDDGEVLLAATNSGIWRTDDGGTTWTQVTLNRTLDVDFHPTDGTRAIAGRDNGRIMRSTDAGVTWVQAALSGGPTPAGRVEVAYAPSNPTTIYASMDVNNGTIWRSTNGGPNFNFVSDTNDNYLGAQGWYDNALWVAPDNANLIVVGGIDLWRSTDGGVSLTRISDWRDYHTGSSAHADHHVIVAHPSYGPGFRRVFFGNDGGIQRATDVTTVAENSGWTNLANNLGITQFYGGASDPEGKIIIGGAQDNDTLRYRPQDGAQGWYQAETGDGGYVAVNYDDANILYAEFVLLAMEKSTDGGQSYFDVVNGLGDAGTNNARFIAPFSMDPDDPNVLIAGGASIWRTTNAAGVWSSIRGTLPGTPLCSAIDIAETNSSHIWVGYDNGRVSRSTNGGTNWSNLDDNGANPLPNRIVTDIAVNPVNSSEAFVTLGGYNNNSVWFTSDGGQNWQQRTGTAPTSLPSVQVNTVRYHPANPQWIYIGTDIGVFVSEDKGLTWNLTPRFGIGHDGPVNTEVSELFWQGDEHLVAATHGRGMYRVRALPIIFVDWSNNGTQDGSLALPYDTVQEALDAAGNGTAVSIEAGDYNEGHTIFHKRGTFTASGGVVQIH